MRILLSVFGNSVCSLVVMADFVTVTHSTIKRLPETTVRTIANAAAGRQLTAKIIAGFDGSGQHKVFNQKEFLDVNSGNIIFAGLALSMIECDGQEVWMDKSLGSSQAERPVGLIPSKETKEVSSAIDKHITDGFKHLRANPLAHTFSVGGKNVELVFNFHCRESQVNIYLLLFSHL